MTELYTGKCASLIFILRIFSFRLVQANIMLSSHVVPKSAVIKGDVILGGLFPIHQKGVGDVACGKINPDRGVQRAEAMLFTIDEINNNKTLLPGIKLGAEIFDTCARGTYALEQSLEFIRATFSSLDVSEFICDDGSTARAKYQPTAVAGVIGGSYSTVSIQVANLLRLFKLPQVSYASTSAALSDKKRYDYFVRTVPPDTLQAKAIVDIVQLFNWTYVSTVASEGEYGESGIDYFQQEARARNICIATSLKIETNSNNSTYDLILTRLLQKSSAKVAILFVRVEDAKGILDAARRRSVSGRFVWIASDGWGKQDAPVKGNDKYAEGALTIELQSTIIPNFDQYFLALNPNINDRNPWFREYWARVHKCRWPSADQPVTEPGVDFCTTQEKLSRSVYQQESKVQFIYDAVYAVALALDAMRKDMCKNRIGHCDALLNINGERLKGYILNTSFTDGYGALVKFDKSGDALGRYSIMNYQRNRSNRKFEYTVVGSWTSYLQLDVDKIVWAGGTNFIPESRCSQPCQHGEVKHVGESGDTCCWICIKCDDWEYVKNEFTCEDCGAGRWPYEDKKSCYDLPEQYMRWGSVFAIVPMCLSCVGILVTMFVIATFMLYNDTPIVMASGRELSYMLLSGCLFCYLMTFVLLAKPTLITCAVQRFGVGFGFSLIYSSLLTKTNRISRIFDSARKSAKRPPFISPKSQIIITDILISIQVVFTIIWLVLEPPGTRKYFPYGKRNEVILKCRTEDISFLVSLIYNMLLIIICTVYAVKTRKIPENFNESKFIGFSMYTTCIIWLAFVPIYFGTLNSFQIQITTLCVSISLSATVALVCLFTPKVYIIVFQPEKNVRKLTMNSATYKKSQGSSSGTANNHDYSTERIKLSVHNYGHKLGAGTTTETETDKDSLASL